mmetsp:Transcript_5136/g.16227  ORF Transcript_5136/g.16227 Transcript_5136/m.16227 type:complete len:287 (+) Transcript_5136:484-1344(+)
MRGQQVRRADVLRQEQPQRRLQLRRTAESCLQSRSPGSAPARVAAAGGELGPDRLDSRLCRRGAARHPGPESREVAVCDVRGTVGNVRQRILLHQTAALQGRAAVRQPRGSAPSVFDERRVAERNVAMHPARLPIRLIQTHQDRHVHRRRQGHVAPARLVGEVRVLRRRRRARGVDLDCLAVDLDGDGHDVVSKKSHGVFQHNNRRIERLQVVGRPLKGLVRRQRRPRAAGDAQGPLVLAQGARVAPDVGVRVGDPPGGVVPFSSRLPPPLRQLRDEFHQRRRRLG